MKLAKNFKKASTFIFSIAAFIVGVLFSLTNVLLEVLEILPPEFFIWLDKDQAVILAIVGGVNALLRMMKQKEVSGDDDSVSGEDSEERVHRGSATLP